MTKYTIILLNYIEGEKKVMYNTSVNNCSLNSDEVYKVVFRVHGAYIGKCLMINSRLGQWHSEWG